MTKLWIWFTRMWKFIQQRRHRHKHKPRAHFEPTADPPIPK